MKRFIIFLLISAVSLSVFACSEEDFSAVESLQNSIETFSDGEDFSFEETESSAETALKESSQTASGMPPEDDSFEIPITDTGEKVFVSNGVLIYGTRGMEQFFGSGNSISQFCSYVSSFKADLGENIKVYSIVAPHASCYYAPPSYANLIEAGKKAFDKLKAETGEGVSYIDAYSILARHMDEDIYPRTEHHWNALAAYYAAEGFAAAACVSFSPLSEYEKVVLPNFVGSLYSFSKSEVIKNNPEDFVYYKPASGYTAFFCKKGNYNFDKYDFQRDYLISKVANYWAFLDGDDYALKITTSVANGRKLVVFKDSYGNAFVPFLVSSFEEIYVLDIRFYNGNGVKLCKALGATDVVFVVSGFTAAGTVYKKIENIRTAA